MVESWPPYCCVPAFFDYAFKKLSLPFTGGRQCLAAALGVKVPTGAYNPYLLPEVSPDQAGVYPDDAEELVNGLMVKMATGIRFRHIPLNTIQFEMYIDVVNAALSSGGIVGIGIDPGISSSSLSNNRHLVRIEATEGDVVSFADDSGEMEPARVTWEKLEAASLAAHDGLWIVADKSALNLPYCLPMSADRYN
jgi:hypothetical protein